MYIETFQSLLDFWNENQTTSNTQIKYPYKGNCEENVFVLTYNWDSIYHWGRHDSRQGRYGGGSRSLVGQITSRLRKHKAIND